MAPPCQQKRNWSAQNGEDYVVWCYARRCITIWCSTCPKCRHRATNQRLFQYAHLAALDATSCEFATPDTIRVMFSDHHIVENLPVDRLFQIGFGSKQSGRTESHGLVPSHMHTWNGGSTAGPQYCDWSDVVAGGDRLVGVIERFREHGALVLRNAGTTQGAIGELIRLCSHAHVTHYGADFHVLAKANPDSVANTGLALPLHTDLPYRADPPPIQALHCLANDAEGGESTLMDGFDSAMYLAQHYPEVSDTAHASTCVLKKDCLCRTLTC
jgi:gamma-butyrobetaine dioxygenase